MPHYSFDLLFQRHILASFISDSKFAKENLTFLNPDYFGNDLLKGVAECLREFLNDEKDAPSKEAMLEEVKKFVAPGRKRSEYEEEIEEIYDLVGINTDFYQKKAREFSRVQLWAGALSRASDFVEAGDIDEVERILEGARKEGESLEPDNLYSFFGKLKERAYSYLHPERNDKARVPTGFYLLDDRIQGGLGQGETGVILAPPKHGKTTALISIAANCLVQGKRVLYITLELREEVILLKFDTNLFGKPSKYIKGEEAKTFYKAMKSLGEKIKGGLTLMEYPTKTLSLSKFQVCIEKTKPEIVFLDYATIMKSPHKREGKRFEITDLHEGLRRIAGECSIPIWTAHQANRPALTAKKIGMEHISEDVNVGAIADVAISINQADDERRKGIVRVHIVGNRLGSTGDSFEYRVRWDLSKIYEMPPEKEDLG